MQEREKQLSDLSRQRHEFRLARLERDKQERAARHKKKRAKVEKDTGTDDKKAAIEAAMARVRDKQKHSQGAPKNINNLTAEQQREIDEVEARRAKRNELSKKIKTPNSDNSKTQ